MVCREDSECDSLGKELVCVKSACEWGTCGCRAGRTAKFVGSGPGKNFKCVPSKYWLLPFMVSAVILIKTLILGLEF